MKPFRGIAIAITNSIAIAQKRTRTTEPFQGFPVVYEENSSLICYSRGIFRREIVVGPDFHRFPPLEQAAFLLHEAAHCRLFHVKQRLICLLTRPWRIFRLCREQELEADREVRAAGMGASLAAGLLRVIPTPSRFHPSREERIAQLI